MNNNTLELLAPAGSMAGLKAVIAAGADAVYIGGARFSARAFADNPEEEDLLAAIDYAHLRGVRMYLTVNTLIKEAELEEMLAFVRPYVLHGIDGILVQDWGALVALHERYPTLPLHASTQMTVTGPESARLLKAYGVTRVVPAREMSLEELKMIHDESGLEVEAFIHGALCYCYSGQCLMSSLIGGRSGNRGRCAQPCRLSYGVERQNEERNSGKKSGKKGTKGDRRSQTISGRLLSPRDLCTLDQLPGLVESGVISYKIEGRMKQPAYAAGVVSVYRRYLDLYQQDPAHFAVREEDRQLLFDLFNREGFTDGYLTRHNGRDMMAMKETRPEGNHNEAVYAEMKRRYVDREKEVPVTGEAQVQLGIPMSLTLTTADGRVSYRAEGPVPEMATGAPLSADRIERQLAKTGGTGFIVTGMSVTADPNVFVPMGQLNALRREAAAGLAAAILAPFRRGEAEICLESPDQEMPADAKASPVSMRRLTVGLRRTCSEASLKADSAATDQYESTLPVLTASCETDEQFDTLVTLSAISRIYYPAALFSLKNEAEQRRIITKAHEGGKAIFLGLAHVERPVDGAFVDHFLPDEEALLQMGIDGFLVRSFETLARLVNRGLQAFVTADASLYTWNHQAASFLRQLGIGELTAPVELNRRELCRMAGTYTEMALYGRQALMVSAQCVKKNTTGCTGQWGFTALTDRTDRQLLVKNECAFCYNVIYNSVPLALFNDAADWRKTGICAWRLMFTDERAAACRQITEKAEAALRAGIRFENGAAFTRGHYGRGVE
ncbi:MAG: U32 family peptidase [Lachnospiraceae bacterium]|nr:U32 family peptidase [Lachnospiraceae bacterium]